MDSAVYSIIGFLSGAFTCYYSFKLGAKSTYDAVYWDGNSKTEEAREFESTATSEDPTQSYDWDEYNSIVKNGPEEEQKN